MKLTNEKIHFIKTTIPEPGFAWKCPNCEFAHDDGVLAIAHAREQEHDAPELVRPAPADEMRRKRDEIAREKLGTVARTGESGIMNSIGSFMLGLAAGGYAARRDNAKMRQKIPIVREDTNDELRNAQDAVQDSAVCWALADQVANMLADQLNLIETRHHQHPSETSTSLVASLRLSYGNACKAESDAGEAWQAAAKRLVAELAKLGEKSTP